jgi:hypothetical protein
LDGTFVSICSKCKALHYRKNQRYCLDCHRENMKTLREKIKKVKQINDNCQKCQRAFTKKNALYCTNCRPTLTKDQLFKNYVRQFTRKCVAKGYIGKENCLVCGAIETEAHHINYFHPLTVMWLCRSHHLEEHTNLK